MKSIFLTNEKKRIVGIVKDYHYSSLRDAISPQCFTANPESGEPNRRQMLIRIKPNSEASALPHIEETFKKLFPMLPYSYQFDNDQNLERYVAEAKWKQVILFGAVLTIFISAFGLFGLSILTAEKRFKEIGIRKVLGASVRVIVVTLSKDFLVLILLAMTLAMPIAYYGGSRWLETYPYRMDIGPGIFIVAGIVVLFTALATISYQSIKTALMNPVDVLRKE
jgi:putative ABC transport system permease protein